MADGQDKGAWWMQGNFAPVAREVETFDLPVEGALPPELSGIFVRTGPNPADKPSKHWFLGDGMLHGVRIEKGRAAWYRGRYVDTTRRKKSLSLMDEVMDRTASTANTNIVRHAGRFLALEEAHYPYEFRGDLSTVGVHDFGGRLSTAFTAHPKICPETGEMFAFGYGFLPPFCVFHRIDAKGALVQSTEIPVGGPVMMHDFGVSRRHVVFMDLPVVFDMGIAMTGGMPFQWSDSYPARLGVMPRDGAAKDIVWFDIPSCYVFHPMNAYDDGDAVVLDVARYEKLWIKGFNHPARLHRFRLDLKTGQAKGEDLDDRAIEFPRVADARAGFKHRYGYAVTTHENDAHGFAVGTRIVKFDL
ncbi:MAG: carotenoid oxygenase family protein, partial [Parvularculaceae bacterium]|nr:carotenoid oxygenase family protein [Parvularculaceae bacterium]